MLQQGWWPYVLIAAVSAALVVAVVVLSRLAWRRQVRRFIVGLVGRREGIGAGLRTVEAAVARLAAGDVADLLAFVAPESEERRAVAEIAERMRLQSSELDDLALPKKLWQLADELGSAAAALAAESAKVGEAQGDEALDALVALELAPVRDALERADGFMTAVATEYGVTDPSVYGGGLYI